MKTSRRSPEGLGTSILVHLTMVLALRELDYYYSHRHVVGRHPVTSTSVQHQPAEVGAGQIQKPWGGKQAAAGHTCLHSSSSGAAQGTQCSRLRVGLRHSRNTVAQDVLEMVALLDFCTFTFSCLPGRERGRAGAPRAASSVSHQAATAPCLESLPLCASSDPLPSAQKR